MHAGRMLRRCLRWSAAGLGAGLAGYAAYAAATWLRYGQPSPPSPAEHDALLDQFIPVYEVVERHRVSVAAPAPVALQAALDMNLEESPVVRAIIRTRELVLGTAPGARRHPRGLAEEMQAIGWGVLADVPGRELVAGAVTRPWEPNVVFRPLPPEQFAAFAEPGYVKIVWTLRADPVDATHAILRHETRAVATDASARQLFRRYWAFVSPGIRLIRWAAFPLARREAERRARAGITATPPPPGRTAT